MGDTLEDHLASMNSSLEDRLAGLEEKMQQSLRQGRRRQMALESLLENQNRTLELLGGSKTSPPLDAIMALAENFALTRLAEPETPTSTILYDKLSNLMDCFDLSLIAEVGVPFDPEKHEACGTNWNSSLPENVVLEVIRPGFLLKNEVLRYATVIVNRFAEEVLRETSEEEEGLL
jgi:molecular chaperone GrpE